MKKIDLEFSLLKFASVSKSNMTIELKRKVCALRNSGGGLIRIKNSDGKQINFRHFHYHFDSVLWKLKSIYSAETFVSIYSFDVEESEESQYLLIKVSASNFIVTENFNTYYIFDSGVGECINERQIESVWMQTQSKHVYPIPRIMTTLTEGKSIDLDEARDIQFKGAENCCFAENFIKSHMKDSQYFRKYVSSFTKNSNGGSVFYGVTEEMVKKGSPKYAVARGIGCNLSEIDRDRIKSAIEDIVYSYKWVRCDRHLLTWKEIKQYFTTIFHMLEDTTDGKYVLEVSVSTFCGLVFTSGGPSYSVFSELNEHEPQLPNEHVLGWVSRIEKDINKNREKYDRDVGAHTISGGDPRYILYYKSNIFDKEEYKTESSKSSILSTVCALRNSGGGELNLQNFNRQCHDVDKWHQFHDPLLSKLTSAFNAECYTDVFHFKMFSDKKGIKLTVASSNNWITRRFNTSFSFDFKIIPEEIITEKQIEYCLIEPALETTSSNHVSDLSLLNDSRFSRCENIYTDKNHDINIDAFLDYMREQLPRTREYVSAFSKVDDGGSIYYGIDADKNTRLGTEATEKKTNVCGLPLDLDNDDMLKIEDMIMWSLVKECTWMRQDGSCLDDKTEKEVAEYVRVIFHRIPPFSADILHRYVLEIRVKRFYGLMFHCKSGPESYYVYDGNVVELSKGKRFEAEESMKICGQSFLRLPLRKWYSKLMEKIMSTGMQQRSSPVLHKKSEKDLIFFASFQDLYVCEP